jgi:1-phosphofructokinase family hexose kinase
MIRVVSLSPAQDVTYQISKLKPGNTLRIEKVMRLPGGKGMNVARIIQAGNHKVKIVLPLGGLTGQWIAAQLNQQGLDTEAIQISAETRTCVAVVAEEVTVLNEPAAAISESEFSELVGCLSEKIEVSVLSGSLPSNLNPSQLDSLFAALRHSSKFLIVDTSGRALVQACAYQPDLLKPNREELLAATGEADLHVAAQSLLTQGARAVLVSDGDGTARFLGRDVSLSAVPRKVKGNPTGAGDAMVALAAISLLQGKTYSELLASSVAAGSLAVEQELAGEIDWPRLADLAASIEVRED